MSSRMVTDCDRCGKENIEDSYRLELVIAGEKRRVDLDTKCLGVTLQELIRNMNPTSTHDLYDKIAPVRRAAAKAEKPSEPATEATAKA